jgi:hypothetical protein
MSGNRRFRKVQIAVVLSLVLIGISDHAWAQFRVYAKVEPNPTGTTAPIVFDVNSEATDNISPNVIFSQDGKRGFVAYAGSGTVLEFSLATGEILNRISTGGKPANATLMPDKRTLLIVSVLDNKIFVVDMDADPPKLEATYAYVDAQFGFGSIVTLSPDGKVGYISSTGTGEIVKFDSSDGRELLRLKGMRYPAQITVTPDGQTLIVVDVDPATPEVVFFDTLTWARKGTLKNPDPTKNVVLFTIFNKAVLAPDGKTGIIASRGQNNVLYTELVFLFDVADGKILKTGNTGTGPGWTGITPDGKNWVIMNMFSLTVIPTDDFDKLQEFQGANGDSIGSANIVFAPDSKFAYYASSPNDLVFQMDLDGGAVLDQLLIGDDPNTLLDQPSSMAISNDGKIIGVLKFTSNNLELLTPNTRVAACKYISSPDMFTGLSLINLSSKTNTITIFAMTDFGEVLLETGTRNAVEYTLAPNQQISYTVAELFNLDDSTAPEGGRTGWIAVYSDEPEITGYLSIGKRDLTSLSGLPLVRELPHDLVIPQIDRNGDAQVEFNSLNFSYFSLSYDIVRVGRDGTVIDAQAELSAYANSRFQQNMGDVFPRDNLDKEGYIWITSPQGVVFTEFYNNGKSTEAIMAIDRDRFIGVKKVYAPQFANVPGFRTTLNLINANDVEEGADVTVTLHAGDGSVLGQFQKHFARGEQLKDNLANIFTDNPAIVDATGWLEVESTQDRILGTVTFNDDDNRYVASFELSGTPLDRFLYPVVSQNETYMTGVALLNSNSEPAQLTVELWHPEGILIDSTPLTLNPQTRTAVYLNSLFPNMDPLLVGNLRIRSDKAIYSFSLMNDSGFNFLMPMLPIRLF